MTYYERICALCKEQGMTLEELSERTGISVHRFRCWNRPKFTPDWDALILLAEKMNLSLEYFAIEPQEEYTFNW